ncbi:sulfatase [Wenyingzhuangia sp. 2_MG-2023]|uniref:sulfatase family protein n=1 Tax=Wenyingzhuangia sp. 2_MG-2023 TaxID=3062639 RepID=UPI0026E307F8|nr:sulfatase [Wenyingzhuangia sp. 2_MG-2023]MDO6737630.1 sulfatase [Wenyingzhuangia sp. 2_MG-2023]
MKFNPKIIFKWSLVFLSLFGIQMPKLLAQEKPNVIILFADDLGYGDLSCYGAQDVQTPNIDALASEGLRFTDFQVASSVCSPSRAALLTGRYPMRNGFPVAQHLGEKHKNYGLHQDEITIADILLEQKYATMAIGKWHLGFEKGMQPVDHGFQDFYGLQSNWHDGDPKLMQLYKNREVVQENVPYEALIKNYTRQAIDFIETNKENPFFLYLAYNSVHSPIIVNKEFIGTSKGSLYGDYVQELDYFVGELTSALSDNKLDENTIVIFLSDNGPALCHFGGSAGPLNGGKYTTMEGGFRIPAIVKWKGEFAAGVNDTFLSSMDLLPTIASLTGAKIPNDRVIDGKDISAILKEGKGTSPHEYVYYYNGANLQAVRKDKWKLHLPRTLEDQPFWSKKMIGKSFKGKNLKNISCKGLEVLTRPLLFNLEKDMGELTDISHKHPEIVKELLVEAERIRKELGDVDIVGTDQRIPPFKNIQEKN